MNRAKAESLSKVMYIDLPDSVGGIVSKDGSGYVVAINRKHPIERQRFTLEHELAHIYMGHFESEQSIEDIESEADRIATEIVGYGHERWDE